MGERGTYQGRPCTRHDDVLAFLEGLYCYHCDRLRETGCRCGRPELSTMHRRTPHEQALRAAETNGTQRRRLAELVAASKPRAS